MPGRGTNTKTKTLVLLACMALVSLLFSLGRTLGCWALVARLVARSVCLCVARLVFSLGCSHAWRRTTPMQGRALVARLVARCVCLCVARLVFSLGC